MTVNKPIAFYSEDECYTLYKKVIENSNKKWESAELLAKHSDYGGAISTHITSMEEMIKALILLFDAKGFDLRKVEGMDIILRHSHKLRHFIGFTMFALNLFIEEMMSFIIKVKENPGLVKDLQKK
jgi:AbiV family abortive infection protein